MNESSTLPVASPPTYLLLIDSRVSNYQLMINAKQPGVYHIVFDVSERSMYSAILIKNIEEKIAELGVGAFTAIGLVQHNDGRPIYEMFGPTADYIKPKIHDIQNADPEIHTWKHISLFITMLRLKYGIQYFDMMACALYSNPDWKYVIDKLTSKTGVTIRASTDDTGAAALGGDWFLESHTGVNLKDVYFTGVIENYDGILVTEQPPPPTSNISLILIDNTIPDIPTIINSLNDTTYCLVFNRDYDTYETILSKLRFLCGENRYILDDFYYETTGDAEEGIPVETPAALQSESNWPFYEDSTTITIQKPVFFQRMKAVQTNTQDSSSNEWASVYVSYVSRGKVRITDLDEIYEIAKTAGEVPSAANHEETLRFGCVGILQHAPIITLGYKLTNMTGTSAIIENVETMDANLSTWSSLKTFITALKTTYHITTLDFMACGMYANPDWKYIIDNLAVQTNITIRASHDNTGTLYEGADWVLETANINLTTVYFTELIYQWSYILPSSVSTLRFDGVDDAVNLGIPAWTYSTEFRSTATIECWFRTTDTNTQKALSTFVSQLIGGNSADMFSLHMKSNGRISFWIVNQNMTFYEFVTTQTYNDAVWHHVAVTFNSANGDTRIYIDGSLTTVGTAASLVPLRYNNTITLMFGSDRAGVFQSQTDRQFRGSLSDIRMWNVVRTATEISTNYRQRLSGNETGLMGYWKMNQGYGSGWGTLTVVLDSTFNRVNGTLTNFASPSTSWVTSTLEFTPRITNFILGPKNGVYDMVDSSFSFIDPSSNSLGTFSYTINNGNATISNGAATTKVIYSNPGPISIPTLNTYDFPMLADLTNWQIDMSFTVTGGSGTYRALIGDMYSDMTPGNRGWGLYISNMNRIYWTWLVNEFSTTNLNVSLNIPYLLSAIQNSGILTLTLTNTLPYNDENTISNLVAMYKFNSSVNDSSVNNNHLTNVGSVSYNTSDYKRGTAAASFNGTNYFQITNDGRFSPDNFTFALWIKPQTNTSYQSIASCRSSSPWRGWMLYIGPSSAGSNLEIWSSTNGVDFTGQTSLFSNFGGLNTWVHLSFTLNKSTSALNVYINGNLFRTTTLGYTNNLGSNLRIGAGANEQSPLFQLSNGTLIDDFRFYNKVLTSTEINTLVQGTSYSQTISVGTNILGRGPVTVGGWRRRVSDGYPNEDLPGTISYVNVSVPTVFRNVTFVSATSSATSITATQDSLIDYGIGTQSASLTLNRTTPTISTWTITDVSFGVAPFTLTAPSSNSNGAFSYSNSTNTGVATVTSSGIVTVVGAGSTTFTATQDVCGNYASRSVTGTLTVRPIAPTISTWTITDVSFGVAPFTLTAPSSNSNGAFVYSNSTNTGVATVTSGGVVTVVGAGSTTFTATQDACGNYTSRSVTGTLTVRTIAPTISTWTITDVSFGVAPFTLTAPSSNSSGAFVYSNSTNTGVATVTSGGVVTIVGAGSTTFTATQDACGNYTSRSVTGTLTVRPIAPTISTWTITDVSFGVAPFTLTAPSSNSNGAFVYSNSTNTGVATVTSGGVVTVVGAGSTTFTATQDACGNYASRSVTGTLTVRPIAPTISTWTITDVSFGVAPFTLTAPSSNSSGAFVYSNSTNTGVATVTSGGVVTIVGAGSTTFTATQDVCGNYTSGSVTGTLTVRTIAPTISTWTISEKRITDISFTLTAPSSNSSGVFTYSTDASGSAIASVTSSGIVTLNGVAGTAVITATQDACGNYTGGSSVSASLVVNAALTNFTVPSDKVYGDSAFDLTDPTTIYSGEPFIFTSSNTYVASIGGTGSRTVTIHKAGSTIITAKQLETGQHPELTITAVLVIAKKTPVITLSSITKNYGDASFNLSPSSTNNDTLGSGHNGDGLGGGLFSYTSSNNNVISIFDTSNVSITGVGSALIVIEQSATMNFTSGSATVAVTINKGTPILSAFTVSTSRTYGSAPFTALAYPTSASNGAIVYSSNDSTVATIDNSGIITLLKAGYVNFTATQAATAYYNSTTKTSNTMTVHRQILLLTRSSPTASIIDKTYGDGYFNVVATNASNGGTITYETDNPSVAGIVGTATAGVISVVSVGTATITARRGQTDQYESSPVSWTVEVARATTTLSGLSDLSYNVTAVPFTVSASSASDGAVTYSLQDPSSNVLTIHPTTGLVTLRAPGSAVIVASQAQGTLYLAPASITSTITVTSAGNALQGATITSTSSFAAVNLEGASLAGVSITNTAFTAAKLSNANLTNAVIVSANFASADLSGATLAGATITGATFTSASLKNADLSGAVLTNTAFTGSDLSGARLTGVDASGASFANAKLTNVDMTGANIENVNFTNTSIKGANISDVSFSPLQKLQLLKNSDNRDIGQIIIPAVTGTTVLAAISETSPLRAIENLDLTTATVAVVIPTTSTSPSDVLPDVVLNVTDNDKFYLPINESEFFQIEGVKYYAAGGVVRNYLTNAVVEVISYNGTPVWLLAGSIVGLVLQTNTLNSSSFVVPSTMLITNTTPFMPTTLPTSNHSETPIVYSSSNTNIATIDSSSGQITVTGNSVGFVHFTATQIQSATYEPGVVVSNSMFVDRSVHFTLTGLNQTLNLSTLATLDASSITVNTTDATAVFYVRLSDINNIFKYQSDSADITNVAADDIKYYVFHRKWPAELKLNPSHAMMNKTESVGMLGMSDSYTNDKSLIKHDFIRYIALRLFNTIHGVDLFNNETELQENAVYSGEVVRYNIDSILSEISTTSSNAGMSYDASGNKYLTNDASGNTNLCRELMRQIAANSPSRFYDNVANQSGLRNVPFAENDSIQFKLIIQAALGQNMLTGVSEIPSRSYTIKLVLKNTVNSSANTMITDSIMYPNSYPYSSSVVTYAPTTESSGVYNIYSPPAPIPFSRFGYNGWYYTNSVAWVSVAPATRNHIKWLVSGNTASSTVGDLKYIRFNLKIHNSASLPYLMIYTQAGSSRKYAVVSGNGSLTNGTVYSFYMNFNSYAYEPSMIGHTNAALGYTVGSGSFANSEAITSIAIESDINAASGNVEFTLSSIIVGELSTATSDKSEKEYGFEAAVPAAYS